MFGFGHLAGYDYFGHMQRGLERRFADAGVKAVFDDVPTPPTGSLRTRTRILAQTVAADVKNTEGPIHLVGHSTGGLDARLILSPSVDLGPDNKYLGWTKRVRTAVSVNTPHFGTPLAGYFATVSGTRMLYAMSLLTFVSLSIGEPSLAIFSRILTGLGGIDRLFGGDVKLFSRLTESILRFVDDDGRAEITRFMGDIRVDQGGVIQIMPEAIDLFNATTEDNPNVRYGSTVSAAPSPRRLRFIRRLLSPYGAFTAAVFSTLYQFTSQWPKMYPYSAPTPQQQPLLDAGFSEPLTRASNDGIVPTLSMLWGKLLWAGEGDHLDVLGHFYDELRPTDHVDWVTSGSDFSRGRFGALLDAIVKFQLASA
jgi:triacylglycerol lipase